MLKFINFVKCINPGDAANALTKGKIYQVIDSATESLYVINDKGKKNWFYRYRFAFTKPEEIEDQMMKDMLKQTLLEFQIEDLEWACREKRASLEKENIENFKKESKALHETFIERVKKIAPDYILRSEELFSFEVTLINMCEHAEDHDFWTSSHECG